MARWPDRPMAKLHTAMAEITLPTEIRLEIVTPEKLVAHDAVSEVTLPGKNGYLGVLPGHAPLLTELAPGELEYTSGGSHHNLVVDRSEEHTSELQSLRHLVCR